MSTPLRRTPLHAEHARHGARFVDFGGWDMPVQYIGTLKEHHAVRTAGGLFDVSHMGEVVVRGPEAVQAVHRLVTNDVTRIGDGRAQYTAMCLPDGGIIDDLIVYRLREDELFLCVNASNREKDFQWIRENLEGDAEATDESDDWCQIALQGPQAAEVLAEVLQTRELVDMRPFRVQDVPWGSGASPIRVATTGYTGSGGYELYLSVEQGPALWRALATAGEARGVIPAGLGARDTLRLEMGYCLYGNDIDETTNPLEAGLGWVTKLDVGDFIGRDALLAQKEAGITRKLVGFVLSERGIARAHTPILVDGEVVGEVTSGTMSPTLKQGIGMGYVPMEHASTGTPIAAEVRGRAIAGAVTRPPFVSI
jgi:aminomethyltransferase